MTEEEEAPPGNGKEIGRLITKNRIVYIRLKSIHRC